MQPSLDVLIEHPQIAENLSPSAVSCLLLRLSAIQTLLAARLAVSQEGEQDELLNVEQLSKMTGIAKGTIYNNRNTEPFKSATRKVGGRLRFSRSAFLRGISGGKS